MNSQPPITLPSDDPASAALVLVNLASDLAEGRRPSPDAAALLASGIRRWLEGEPLELSLGLRGNVGIDCARTLLKRRERNHHLRQAASLCPGESAWKKSLALSSEISTFLSRIWPQWKDRPTPPANASALRTELFHAARAGRLPESPSQLHDITTMKP